MVGNFGMNIIDEISKELDFLTIDHKKSSLDNLIKLVDIFQKKIQNEYNKMDEITKLQEKIASQINFPLGRDFMTEITLEQQRNINFNNFIQIIGNLTMEGYEILNKIRKIITGETITYRVGVGSKRTDKLIEGNLTYEDLINNNKIGKKELFYYDPINKSIRMRASAMRMTLNEIQKNAIQAEKLIEQNSVYSTLYSQMYRFYNGVSLRKMKIKTDYRTKHTEKTVSKSGKEKNIIRGANFGNFYEAYQIAKGYVDNGEILDENRFYEIINQVLKNVGFSGSFTHGGDQGLEQVKGFFGSDATFISTASVVNGLKDLVNALRIFSQNGSLDSIKNLLLKSQGEQIIEEVGDDAALKALEEFFSNIK